MMKFLRLWYTSTFKVISQEKAKSMGLTFVKNIYGDPINDLNCRSIWMDDNYNSYRVHELYEDVDAAISEKNRRLQETVDMSIARYIEYAAQEALEEYNRQVSIDRGPLSGCGLIVVKPGPSIYMIYDFPTAKYKDVSITKLAEERFSELLKAKRDAIDSK